MMRRHHLVRIPARLSGLVLATLIPLSASAWQQNQRLWSAPWSWMGPAPAAQAGYSVSSGGDVNGDGIDDIAFSAPFDTTGGEYGTIYIVFGSALGWQPELPLAGSGIASFKGENVGDHPGWSVAIVPSINGDVYDDLVIGAPANDDAEEDAGKVYIVFGKETGWGQEISLSTADASYLGEDYGHRAGHVVASAGDVNGDGKGDILIGAPMAGTGKVYLLLGKGTGWAHGVSLANADASCVGEADATGMGRAGFTVAGVPDLNSDGRDEILIGAPKYSPDWDDFFIGKAYLILGRATGWMINESLANADKSFLGAVAGDEMGSCVSAAGDIDNDGKGDFLISTPIGTGSVYVWRGASLAAWGQDTPPTAATTQIVGSYASTGAALCSLGDVNGDSYDDFAVGAPDWGAGYGKAYAVFGRAAANWPAALDIETAEGGWQGVGHKDWAGRGVAGGDVNGDGLADLILGVDGSPFAGYDAGLIYVIPSNYGSDDTPPAGVSGFQAQVDLVDSLMALSWNTVTVDVNGGPEDMLFYRALRYRYPSATLQEQLPAIIHPQHALVDSGWTPWSTAQTDTTSFYDEYDYYRVLAVDKTGNASNLSARVSVFQVIADIP